MLENRFVNQCEDGKTVRVDAFVKKISIIVHQKVMTVVAITMNRSVDVIQRFVGPHYCVPIWWIASSIIIKNRCR